MAAFEDRTGPELDQYVGNKWTDWLTAVQSTDQKPQPIIESTSKRDIEVARLGRPDMGLFGYRPATDRFYLVVCEHCGQLVKPQSMNTHYERKHKNKIISKKSLSSRVKSVQGCSSKHAVDKSNHRIVSPPHTSKQTSRSNIKSSHSLRHSTATDKANDISKTDIQPEKVASSEKPKRSVETSAKNHRPEGTSMKGMASQQSLKSRVSTSHERSLTQSSRQHHVSGTSNAKTSNKPGGTIQLNELPEPQVVNKTSSHHNVSGGKHRHRRTSGSAKLSENETIHTNNDRKRTEKAIAEPHISNTKSKRSYNAHPHHHHHQTNQLDNVSDVEILSPESVMIKSPGNGQKLPRVVLDKTVVPVLTGSGGSVRVGHTPQKRTRPHSGNSESSSSSSPPRAKVQAIQSPARDKDPLMLQKPTHNSAKSIATMPIKSKKKEKARLLPLKAREYDPNVHCGVWVKEESSNCTRSLTCKVHSRSAKRAVTGRSKQFDELNQDHRREKQRLKEKTLLAHQPAMTSPPPLTTTAEFAVPSPTTKPIVVSSSSMTTSVAMTTPASQPIAMVATATSKTKSTINLFPKIFAPWHVDCWDNDEIIEEPSTPSSSCLCVSQHPQPITVFSYPARRLGTCQVSYSRKLERQLESFSVNVQKFGTKVQKTSKPFSFTPIGAATYQSSIVVNETPQPTSFSNENFLTNSRTSINNMHQTNTLFSHSVEPNDNSLLSSMELSGIHNVELFQTTPTPPIAPKPRTKVNRKLSNLAPSGGNHSDSSLRNRSKSEQACNLLRRTISGNSDSGGRSISNAGEVLSSSPQFFLSDLSNNSMPIDTSLSPNVMQMTANPASVGSCNTVPVSRNEMRNHNVTRPLKAKSKSAISKYATVTQNQLEPLLAEHIDSSPVTVQLPNGINSLSGNVILKPGSHSVTLSGNIGALTVTGEDPNFTGSQISQHLKNMNSNNNFVMSNDTTGLNIATTKSKHFAQQQQLLPQQHLEQNAISLTNRLSGDQTDNFILQSDDIFSINQPSVERNLSSISLDQFAMQNTEFTDQVNIDNLQQITNDNEASAEILRLLCAPTEQCDILQTKLDNNNLQLANMSQIDSSILEQMFASQNSMKHNHRSLDTAQGCSSSSTSSRTTNDLGQNFITQ